MHIEKNICDNILGIIMNIKGKTEDTIKTRLDLERMGLRSTLHLLRDSDKLKMPPVPYTLSLPEKRKFCQFLKELKVPDGFSLNIFYGVNMKEAKISGLKSHGFHVILQHLLQLALLGLLTPSVQEAIIGLSVLFATLGTEDLRIKDLKQIQAQIPITLCKLEKEFPLTFFDVMVHLPTHLAHEAKFDVPVQFRHVYSIEQTMYTYKSYIHNRGQPEGSIVEGYLAYECMTICSSYLQNIETKFNHVH